MIHAGIDVGSLWTKAVVLKDGAVAGWSVRPTGDSAREAADEALRDALAPLAATPGDLGGAVVATGAGKRAAQAARETAAEIMCAARGAAFLRPGARGVLDMGGESTRVVRLDEKGEILDYALNDKCAAGTGVFLDAMGAVMGVPVDRMGPLSLESDADVNITSMCVAFAESEVVSQVHRQTPKKDILRGLHKSIATRIAGMASRVGLTEGCVAVGGLALNSGIVWWLEEMLRARLVVPENPQIVPALGAALIAAGRGERG